MIKRHQNWCYCESSEINSQNYQSYFLVDPQRDYNQRCLSVELHVICQLPCDPHALEKNGSISQSFEKILLAIK